MLVLKDRYNIDRGKFGTLDDTHYGYFEDLLGKDRVIRDPEECEAYNVDWVKNVKGKYKNSIFCV